MAKHKKSSTHSSHTKVKVGKTQLWKYATFVLGLLLIASVFTNGFRLNNNLNTVINDLNRLNARENSPQVKSAITEAINSLIKADQSLNTGSGDKVIIEEYSDFECPFCGRAFPTVKTILEEYGNQVQFVYKHFPLSSIHPNAQKAAEASECARDQGKFEVYHDTLFQNQRALTVNDLKRYASQLSLDTNKFNSCLDNGDKASIVEKDFQEGQQRGVRGTPTFFINGQSLVGAQPYENIKAVIDAQLSGSLPAQPTQPSQPSQPTQPTVPAGEAQTSIDDDPVRGNVNAKVVLVEFSDFQCPFCKRFHDETLPSIKSEYIDTGKIRFVYRDFPLTSIHPQAAPSAEAAECANEQDMFWEFHDKLFENQGALSVQSYKAWAAELGLDTNQFNDCVDSRKYQSEVSKDLGDGSSAGVTGTPGFVLGILQSDGKTVIGIPIKGAQPYANFKSAIDAQLALLG